MEAGAAASSEFNGAGDQDAVAKGKTPQELQTFWAKEKEASDKRLRKYHKQGNAVVRRFTDERSGQNDDGFEGLRGDQGAKLNLFHTNISILLSMLYGSTPKIEVAREHHDPDDDVARVASLLFQRILEADVRSSGDDLSTTLKAALQDRLLPGMGTARVRYEFTTQEQEITNIDGTTTKAEMLTGEFAPIDYVHWQDFAWGWARTWSEIPWLGYRAWMDKDEATKRFGADKAELLEYKNQLPSGDQKNNGTSETDQKNNIQKAEIWEYWHKADRMVYWWSNGLEATLDQRSDPLQLDGFWPSPKSMVANLTTTLYTPKADFVIAQDLYNEIDELQSRIATITRAIKVVGVYDKNQGESVGRMLKEGGENDLIPVDNWAMFAEKGGLKGSIDWFPVETVVGVLQTLGAVQGERIEQLNMITGMSDIMQGGNTDQYTPGGTQQLKAKMGSIRVQALQEEFATFASELDGLKAEVISKHFNQESIAVQSSAQFIPMADRDKIGPAMALMKSPDIKWRVNIRPETIAMIDYAQLKAERTEFLMAMATYIQSASSAAQAMPGALPVLLEMLKWGMAGFKGANYLEGTMDQAIEMSKKQPQQDEKANQEKQKQDAEMQKMQMQHQFEVQKIQMKGQMDMQVFQAKMQGEMQKMSMDHQQDMQAIQAKGQADIQKIAADLKADLMVIKRKSMADAEAERQQAVQGAAEAQVNHENTLKEGALEHEYTLEEIGANGEIQAMQQDAQNDTD